MTESTTESFSDLGIADSIVSALAEQGVEEPFPIQTAVIRAALAGQDLCGKAPTGSGKTLAFGLPTVHLAEKGRPWHPKVLILAPTRELATQIKQELAGPAKARSRTIGTVFGGTNIERDIRLLERGVDILVACPGRLEDLIARRCCELRDVRIAVVDEADRMADMGFLPAVRRILDLTPDDRQTLLFSATLDGDVDELVSRYQNDPVTYEVEADTDDLGEVEHSWYRQEPSARIDEAAEVLRRFESAIVFCRTRRGCDRVNRLLRERGIGSVAIHGDRSQAQRERALADFTSGRAYVLVATDVAARGIHVDDVSLVMHYDPANSDKDYIHRSGRTGRAGRDGRVISLVVEDKEKIARELQKDLGVPRGFDTLDLAELPPVVERRDPEPAREPKPSSKPRSGGGRGKNDQGKRSNRRDSRNAPAGRRRRSANDWYPPESRDRQGRPRDRDDDESDRPRRRNDRQGPGRGRADGDRDNRGPRQSRDGEGTSEKKKPRSSGPKDRRASGPPSGRNTAKKKSRRAKGRHADRNAQRNKGHRRGR